MRYRELIKVARKLEKELDTDWAQEHENVYDAFADQIESEYSEGRISAHQFNELALIAFYDYPDGLKEEE